jgi:uroporphyrinogen III methyltransferase/synthase
VSRPLDGRRVVVTRPALQSDALAEGLERLGADVVLLPLTRIVPVDDSHELAAAIDGLDRYAVVAVTSANGAACLGAQLRRRGRSIPAGVLVAAVGDATAGALADVGIRTDLVPERATGAALAATLAAAGVAGARVLVARARTGRPEIVEGLRAAGAFVDDVALYDTERLAPDPAAVARALGDRGATVVVLTAPSAVETLAAAIAPEDAPGVAAVTMGPTTSAAARAAGMTVAAEAAEQSVAGLVAAVRSAVRP